MAEEGVEAVIQRISTHKGVEGIIVLSREGQVLKTTCDSKLAQQHAELVPPLAEMAKNVIRDLDPQNNLEFLRIRSNKHELMVSTDAEFVLIAIQTPSKEA